MTTAGGGPLSRISTISDADEGESMVTKDRVSAAVESASQSSTMWPGQGLGQR
eukprot:CAMPEP_0197856778 /NCGR_PEP_ID=MMETSP1438-20131217/29238_1 /TAXON_ID=1461541 /ORGANISM="Pterosperma sp., Strain CCMP1384" /LENGTH=52 /DNA_ID=CAMNT_0043472359 /DNA_START=329 /DNA_END=487 /DNA_ORIENTATION=-